MAARLGLNFSPANDYELADRFGFLDKLAQGSNRYAFNVISGSYRQNQVLVFDYHYETHSTDSKGNRQTHHHYFSFFILLLPISFPELKITREGLLSKIAQALVGNIKPPGDRTGLGGGGAEDPGRSLHRYY